MALSFSWITNTIFPKNTVFPSKWNHSIEENYYFFLIKQKTIVVMCDFVVRIMKLLFWKMLIVWICFILIFIKRNWMPNEMRFQCCQIYVHSVQSALIRFSGSWNKLFIFRRFCCFCNFLRMFQCWFSVSTKHHKNVYPMRMYLRQIVNASQAIYHTHSHAPSVNAYTQCVRSTACGSASNVCQNDFWSLNMRFASIVGHFFDKMLLGL